MASGPEVGFLERYGAPLALLGLGTVAMGVLLLRGGLPQAEVLRTYFLAAGFVLLYLMVQRVRRLSQLGPFVSQRRAEPAGSALPLELDQLQNALRASRSNRTQFDLEITPLLRQVAEDRLARSGVSLSRQPERAAARLSPGLRELLLTPSGERSQSWVPGKQEMAALVEELGRLGT